MNPPKSALSTFVCKGFLFEPQMKIRLSLPPGMNHVGFQIAIGTALRNTRIFQEMDKLTQQSLSDHRAHTYLIERCGIAPKDAARRWQVIKRWLSEIFPDEFRIEANQEILLKGKNI